MLALAALAAVGTLTGGLVWLLTYDPLVDGGLGVLPKGSLESARVDDGLHDPVYFVSRERPGTFVIGYEVANRGRLAVTLEGLDSGGAFVELGMGKYPTGEAPDDTVPGPVVRFEPVTIEPGESRFLQLGVRIPAERACRPEPGVGTTLRYGHPRLRYSYAGVFSRTAAVEAPFTIVVVCGELPADYPAFGL